MRSFQGASGSISPLQRYRLQSASEICLIDQVELEAGIAAVRAGVTAADVARAENAIFRKHDLGDYVTNKYTRVRGHGLGLMPDMKPFFAQLSKVD